MAEQVDAQDLKSCWSNPVPVRFWVLAPFSFFSYYFLFFLGCALGLGGVLALGFFGFWRLWGIAAFGWRMTILGSQG